METNIALMLRDKRHLDILNRGQIVGGVHLNGTSEDGQLGRLSVIGFNDVAGPWGCGTFKGKDVVAYFEPDGEKPTTTYIAENEELVMELTLESVMRYSTTFRLVDSLSDVEFHARGDAEIGILGAIGSRDSYIGRIWSKLQRDGEVPYPHDSSRNPRIPHSIQICGFEEMGELVPDADTGTFIADVRLYRVGAGTNDGYESRLQLRVNSVENVFPRLYSAGPQGIETLLLGRTVPELGKEGQVSGLIKQLETQVKPPV